MDCNAWDDIFGINVLCDASKSFFFDHDGRSTGIPLYVHTKKKKEINKIKKIINSRKDKF